jgi:hypothetical protein
MRTLMLTIAALSLGAAAAHADWGRPLPPPPPGFDHGGPGWDHGWDHGPGWGPGRGPGWDHGPGWGRPLPPPPPPGWRPGFPPPPPPAQFFTQYMECASNGYNLNFCAVPGFIVNAAVTNQESFAACQLGNTYGYQGNQLWVKDGCRATFMVQYRQ